MRSHFDEKKATQLAGFLIHLEGERMNYMKLIKLLYICDREALKKWGSPLTGDEYFSLPHGPIVSRVYDLIADEPKFPSTSYWNRHIVREDYDVILAHRTSTDNLAKADIELLTEIYSKFGSWDQWELSKYTEKFAEWKDPDGGRIEIRYSDILKALGNTNDDVARIERELEDINSFANLLLSSN